MRRSWRGRCVAVAGALALLTGTADATDPVNLPSCEQPTGYQVLLNIDCPGDLHPGDAVSMPGFVCTLNFLWRGSDGHRYMGTAGHCTLESKVGDRAERGDGGRIGSLAYTIYDTRKFGADFALIRLDPKVKASPQMRYWGGPTKYYAAMTDQPQFLRFAGQALGVSLVAPNREVLATAVTQPEIIRFNGGVSLNDSGGGVITEDGQAAGLLTAMADGDVPIATSASGGIEVGEGQIVRIAPAVAQAEKALGIRLTLQTAPLRKR